jgi:hypothetical protein
MVLWRDHHDVPPYASTAKWGNEKMVQVRFLRKPDPVVSVDGIASPHVIFVSWFKHRNPEKKDA